MFEKSKPRSTAKLDGAKKKKSSVKRPGARKSAEDKAAKRPDARKPSRPAPRAKATDARAPRKTQGLRKPVARPAVNLGIGPIEIMPPRDQAWTLGMHAAEAAMDKKATDIVVLDVRGVSGLCDEMVVASARSVTHLGAVCDAVEEALRLKGERVLHSDGRHSAEPDWILLDYGNLMVHLFRPEAREHTRLEDYYSSAKLVAKFKNEE